MKEDSKDEILVVSIILLMILFLVFIIVKSAVDTKNKATNIETAFNNGICPDCGNNYKFLQAVGHSNDKTGYIYICEECGKSVEYTKYVMCK